MSTSNEERSAGRGSRLGASQFEAVYRAHVGAVAGFFARGSTDPQTVADLASETFVRAISSIHTFEGRGSLRGWLLAIARAVHAQHQAKLAERRQAFDRLNDQVELHHDELEDLAERIDAQRAGRELLKRAAQLRELERSSIELVDLEGLAPQDAAHVLDISPGALRVRLFRARARLRKGGNETWAALKMGSGATSSIGTGPSGSTSVFRCRDAGPVRSLRPSPWWFSRPQSRA